MFSEHGDLTDASRNYTYSHLIFLADATDAVVVENNMSGLGTKPVRAARTDTSTLQSFITWPYTQMLGVVNCFMLDGQVDNYNVKYNTLTYQMMTYVPSTRQFQNFFKPGKDETPTPPTFFAFEIKK